MSDIEVWRGGVDRTLLEHERRLTSLNGNIAAGTQALTDMRIEMAKANVKLGLGAAVGASAMSVATGVLVFFLSH